MFARILLGLMVCLTLQVAAKPNQVTLDVQGMT